MTKQGIYGNITQTIDERDSLGDSAMIKCYFVLFVYIHIYMIILIASCLCFSGDVIFNTFSTHVACLQYYVETIKNN